MLLVTRKNGKYNKLSNKIIVSQKLYSDKNPLTQYLMTQCFPLMLLKTAAHSTS